MQRVVDLYIFSKKGYLKFHGYLSHLFPQFSIAIGHYYFGLNFTESNRDPKYSVLNKIENLFLG